MARRMSPPSQGDLISRAYDALQAQIVSGRLAPGSRIIESDLADRLGVSRTPVRSALQRLQQEGFVRPLEGGRNLRLIVCPLTREDCVEVLNLLGAVEGLAARRAASFGDRDRAALVREMEAANDELERVLASPAPDPQEVFRAHSRFHNAAVERVGSRRLDALHATIAPQAERYRRVYITTAPQGFDGEIDEHRQIVAALSRGESERAQSAVQANWERAAARLGGIVERLGERGTW